MLKKTTSQVSRGHTALDVSEAISEHLTKNDLFKVAEREAEEAFKLDPSVNPKKIKNDIINKHIDEFMTSTLTDEARDKLYSARLDEFLTTNNTFGALNDVALPFTHMDDTQITSMNGSVKGYRDRLDTHIRNSVASLTNVKLDEGSPLMNMSMDDISNYLSDSLKGADEFDAT